MNGLTNILDVIGSHPAAQWVVAAFALRAALSVAVWKVCPVASGRVQPTPEQAAAAALRRQRPVQHSWRFLGLMLAGIGLSVVGLWKLAHQAGSPALDLLLLVLGIYLFTTEPVRQGIRDAQDRVIAATTRGPEVHAASIDILRDSHVKLIAAEVAIVALLIIGMIAL